MLFLEFLVCTSKFTWSNLLDVRGSVHHSTIHKEKSNKMQQCIKILLFHIYMNVVRHVAPHNVYQLHVKQPSIYEKPEAASAVLGS
jgi:hypothetical protein